MKVSICNELFDGWQIEEVFKYVARLGYDGVEIAPFTICSDVRKMPLSQVKGLRELAESYVPIVGLHWLLVSPPGLHIFTNAEETLDYMKSLADFCSKIGGKVLVFGSPKQRNVPGNMPREKAWKKAVDFFSKCASYAEEYGVYLLIEPLARHLTNFINTVDEALKLIEEVNHPHFQLILDVYSMCDERKPLREIILRGAKYLKHFHANDDNKQGPGFGNVNYREVIKTLKEVGYTGFLSVEVFDTTPGVEKIAEQSIKFLKKLLREM